MKPAPTASRRITSPCTTTPYGKSNEYPARALHRGPGPRQARTVGPPHLGSYQGPATDRTRRSPRGRRPLDQAGLREGPLVRRQQAQEARVPAGRRQRQGPRRRSHLRRPGQQQCASDHALRGEGRVPMRAGPPTSTGHGQRQAQPAGHVQHRRPAPLRSVKAARGRHGGYSRARTAPEWTRAALPHRSRRLVTGGHARLRQRGTGDGAPGAQWRAAGAGAPS